MMKLALGLVFAAAIAAQDDEIARAAVQGFKHPWEGFTSGSTVTYRETTKRPELSADGKLVLRDEVLESVWTVVATEGEKPTLRLVSGGRESVIPFYLTPPSWMTGKGARAGEEEIVAGGAKFACEVTTITLDSGQDLRQVTTISRSAKAPVWAVRRKVETFVGGRQNTLEEELLVGVNEKVRVGDAEVVCQVVQVTVEASGAAKAVKREWRSDAVPGRLVRREARYYQGTREVESAATHLEVVSFKTKK